MRGYLIDDKHDIEKHWLDGVSTICITAGASAPERLVQDVIVFLQEQGFDQFEELDGADERISFKPALLENKR